MQNGESREEAERHLGSGKVWDVQEKWIKGDPRTYYWQSKKSDQGDLATCCPWPISVALTQIALASKWARSKPADGVHFIAP